MGNRTDRPQYWPTAPGALSVEDLRRFKPLNYTPVAQAYALGFLDSATLKALVSEDMMRTPSSDLVLFLSTSSMFDRKRDIEEELRRLSRLDPPDARPLWMLLARLIVDECDDPANAIAMLEEIYQWCDRPEDLWPYTLYADSQAGATPADVVRNLGDFLHRQNV
jgi:hypothetical protein